MIEYLNEILERNPGLSVKAGACGLIGLLGMAATSIGDYWAGVYLIVLSLLGFLIALAYEVGE